MVGTFGMKVSELAFILYFDFSYLTLPFTLDVKPPASQADGLFLIVFEAQ